VAALISEPNQNDNIYPSVNTHKILLKAGAKGDTFKAKAKELFKYAQYF